MVSPHTHTKNFIIILVTMALQLPLNGFAAGDIPKLADSFLERFNRGEVRFLVSTEAGGEGIDLCHRRPGAGAAPGRQCGPTRRHRGGIAQSR